MPLGMQQIKAGLDISKVNFLTHKQENIRELAAYVIGEKHFLSNWKEKDIFVPEDEEKEKWEKLIGWLIG